MPLNFDRAVGQSAAQKALQPVRLLFLFEEIGVIAQQDLIGRMSAQPAFCQGRRFGGMAFLNFVLKRGRSRAIEVIQPHQSPALTFFHGQAVRQASECVGNPFERLERFAVMERKGRRGRTSA